MRPRSSVVRRLGAFGVGAIVVGAVLVGTGVAVSAKTVPVATANKKKPTTTTTTTMPLPTTTTTTQPCSASPTTQTVGSESVTLTPGTCIVDGTQVTITGSGFTPNELGTYLECNADGSQPTVMFEGSPIPISCTNPLSQAQGPGIVTTSATGTIGPDTFTIDTGATGPPCAPTSCTGASATDSSGGDPFTDAAKYPCGPPGAFPDDDCVITFGDNSSDAAVSVPITFNPNTPPPPVVTPTPGATATTAPAATKAATTAKAAATKATSGSLAFTGSGPGLWWLALVGIILMALGIFSLVLVDQPRRLARLTVNRITGSKPKP